MALRNVKIKWFGVAFVKQTLEEMERNVGRAAVFLQSKIQKSMRQGGGKANVHRSGARKGGGSKKWAWHVSKEGMRRMKVPKRSKPGQSPFVQTGRLRQSIFSRRSKGRLKFGTVAWQVGTNLAYGVALEFGVKTRTIKKKGSGVLADPSSRVVFGRSVKVTLRARPFIRTALKKHRLTLGKIIATGKV